MDPFEQARSRPPAAARPQGRRRTVVITGASSGMGRALARRLAARGDNVVVSARRADALREVARECEALGGAALDVPADVTDEDAVEHLAQSAAARFGRVDAWVNTAAVAAFGHLWETPTATLRRLVDVNVTGSILVAKAALRRFEADGGGTLVLVSSILGKTPIPYLGVYTATKHAVVGLAASLRADLKEAGIENVRVVNVMPPSTDTPFYVHAANYAGRVPRPPPPVYPVDTLADALVAAVDSTESDDVVVGAMGKLMRAAHAVAPGLYESLTAPYSRTMFTDRPAPRGDRGVLRPTPEGRDPSGGWKAREAAGREGVLR